MRKFKREKFRDLDFVINLHMSLSLITLTDTETAVAPVTASSEV